MEKLVQSFNPSSDGWQFMWLILIVGISGFGVAAERMIYIFLKSSKGRAEFMLNFGKLLSAKKYEEALAYANSSKLPVARIMHAIVSNKDKGREGMTSASDAVFLTEAPRVNRYMSMIGVIASISTLLGLMGTIYGLIYTFDAVANKPAAERPKALADGIAIAMGTTLMGLLVAVPLLAIQGFLLMIGERVIEEMEEKGLKIINSLS
jgi:biopolymer transport protein ExbB/TolQ